ncbi:DUF4956 domain-containing protein [Glutamicibacter protophormiae]|uniref:DUF4956 domain-containing protein n=1 Tax=Glutamicibacter protophormiae TaxID=37930 RepID=UPI002A7EC7DD|nr:DUF4956 domain-containing protein [Glutamicibacter protophormiae]WPR64966.1 DUF4956 domain-containing protein [Glutamicibacter protophormiae]WPR68462.1 DUF4956 domain-containing protein [Glutamicibacter protophormiae]
MLSFWMALAANVIGMTVLIYFVYFRRHFRRDLVLAYIALSMGIFAVTMLLSGSGAGVGLGMGLFGILSIIRLRSDTLTQEEVAYYFISLAIGLVNGLHPDPAWFSPAVTAALVLVMFLADHPGFAPRTQRQTVTLEKAYPRSEDLARALEGLLGAKILRTVVIELDMVRDLTIVDVRFRVSPTRIERGTSGSYRLANAPRQNAPVAQESWS